MSDPVTPTESEMVIDKTLPLTLSQKIYLLQEWKTKVEEELAEHQEKRDGIYKKYKAQKERYDAILSQPLKKMKRLDMFINTRKKVLLEVSKEIELATKKEETATDPAP